MRHVCAALLLALAACSDPDAVSDAALDRAAARAAEDGRIECAIRGAADFERACTLERVSGTEGAELVLRAPDGGFRRLVIATDGRGVVAADGSEPAIVSVVADNRIEVAIGGDRYRLPATVAPTRR